MQTMPRRSGGVWTLANPADQGGQMVWQIYGLCGLYPDKAQKRVLSLHLDASCVREFSG